MRAFIVVLLLCCACPAAALARVTDEAITHGASARPERQGLIAALETPGSPEAGAAATPSAPSDESATPEFLRGSFVGALLFGHPYEGLGAVDIACVALVALLAFSALLRRRSSNDDEEYDRRDSTNVSRRGDRSWQDRGEDQDRPQKQNRPAWSDREALLPKENQPGRDDPPAPEKRPDPRDNAWSRKLGGEGRPSSGDRDKQGWDWGQAGRENRPDPRQDKERQAPPQRPKAPQSMKDRAEMLWRYYADEGQTESDAEAKWPAVAPDVHPPADFDVVDFLEGARALYIKLQQSWAARRVDDLEPFVNPKLFRALQGQAARDPKPVTVDILLVDAELIQLDRLAEREEAKVRFSVSMRSGNETLPQDIHEVWLFSRGEKSKGMWRLDGIEQ